MTKLSTVTCLVSTDWTTAKPAAMTCLVSVDRLGLQTGLLLWHVWCLISVDGLNYSQACRYAMSGVCWQIGTTDQSFVAYYFLKRKKKSTVLTSRYKRGIYFTVIGILILKNNILPVLGLNSGYTVKYSPLPLGVPSGFALGNFLRQRAIFDRTSLVSS